MLEDVDYQSRFYGAVLDENLAMGYYRMYQEMFTTNFLITNDGNFYRVFWLRTLLNNTADFSKHSIIRKNRNFTYEISMATNSYEIEELYACYKTSIDFETADNIQAYIFGEAAEQVFDCLMIQVRDYGRLIAVGFFDQGINAIEGIINFYHPDYKKYSLGKFLMLLKMQYAISKGMRYYYTGYIALDYAKFDYKLFPTTEFIEVFLPIENCWIPFPKEGIEGLRVYDI